jgi:hypothetical protein
METPGSQADLTIPVKHSGTTHQVTLPSTSTFGDLKATLVHLTHVPRERQKLMGVKSKPAPTDDSLLVRPRRLSRNEREIVIEIDCVCERERERGEGGGERTIE